MNHETVESLQQRLGWQPPSATLELSLGIAKLKVELGEFVGLIRGFVGAVQLDDVRVALREMMDEVGTTFETIADVLAPLYEIDSEAEFKRRFTAIRADYKKTYLKSSGFVRTHCGVIADKMDVLVRRRGWLGKVPVATQSYKRLKSLCANWLLLDWVLVDEMDTFLKSLNRVLNDVQRERQISESSAYERLWGVLDQMEDDLTQIKGQLDELRRLSSSI
jgi:hypothetical protein